MNVNSDSDCDEWDYVQKDETYKQYTHSPQRKSMMEALREKFKEDLKSSITIELPFEEEVDKIEISSTDDCPELEESPECPVIQVVESHAECTNTNSENAEKENAENTEHAEHAENAEPEASQVIEVIIDDSEPEHDTASANCMTNDIWSITSDMLFSVSLVSLVGWISTLLWEDD